MRAWENHPSGPAMGTLLLCPCCGGGLPTRRGLRRHLVTHGMDSTLAFRISSTAPREIRPTNWLCALCHRQFTSARGLFVHVRASGHRLRDDPLSARPPGLATSS